MNIIKTTLATGLVAFSLTCNARPYAYEDFSNRFVSDEGCVVTNSRVSALNQAHLMFLSLILHDENTFERAYGCVKGKLTSGGTDLLPSALYGPDPKDNNKERILNSSKPAEASILMAWDLLQGGRIYSRDDLTKEGKAFLEAIKKTLVRDEPLLGRIISSSEDQDDGAIELSPASLAPFTLSKLCLLDHDFCKIRDDSSRALARGLIQGFIPDRIILTKEGALVTRENSEQSDAGLRFLHYLGLTNDGCPQKDLLLSKLKPLTDHINSRLRPPVRVNLYTIAPSEGKSGVANASGALVSKGKASWFSGGAIVSDLKSADDPLALMTELEALLKADLYFEIDANGDIRESLRDEM